MEPLEEIEPVEKGRATKRPALLRERAFWRTERIDLKRPAHRHRFCISEVELPADLDVPRRLNPRRRQPRAVRDERVVEGDDDVRVGEVVEIEADLGPRPAE